MGKKANFQTTYVELRELSAKRSPKLHFAIWADNKVIKLLHRPHQHDCNKLAVPSLYLSLGFKTRRICYSTEELH